MSRPVLKANAGLTLLEVLIGVIILTIAASILVVSSRTSITGQLRSKVYGDAATATKEALESIQLLPLDSLSLLKNAVMQHSQGPAIEVKATIRGLVSTDVNNIAILDTTTLRYLTLDTYFKAKSGATVVKNFHTIVYRP
jgi:prepilin-type N-terminal cleavage/methylation domain-containing protein